MEKKTFITINDYQRLMGLVELAALKAKNPLLADRLVTELKTAKMLPQENISNSIVTMNSRVLLKEITSGRETEITITYPTEADSKQRKVSVFSTIGIELLGCQEGDIVSWQVPNGMGKFRVEKVTYQPEAAGHFYL